MFVRTTLISVLLVCLGVTAQAEFAKVENQADFIALIKNKLLKRPFVELSVTPDGRIEGTGARWDVTGSWTWENGFFCRDLFWGGDELGYNCQEVRAHNNRMRFTSDQGQGQSAVFRIE
ncbi:MAG: dihydrodipicolinate reductase [Aliishimia sp.]